MQPTHHSPIFGLAKSPARTMLLDALHSAKRRDHLGDEQGLNAAIDWCRQTGVTKVYVETFRSNYFAPSELLQRARDRFRQSGIEVSGCVTTTIVGQRSTGWDLISCYTDPATQDRLQAIFEFTAGLFDEIMIDDFWFTDCENRCCVPSVAASRLLAASRLYLFADGSWVVENFHDETAAVKLDDTAETIPPRDWARHWSSTQGR